MLHDRVSRVCVITSGSIVQDYIPVTVNPLMVIRKCALCYSVQVLLS